jgi:hypothetical protein
MTLCTRNSWKPAGAVAPDAEENVLDVAGAIVPTICTRRPTHEFRSLPVRRYPVGPADTLKGGVPLGETSDGDAVAVTDVDPVVPIAPAVVVPAVPVAPTVPVVLVPATPVVPVAPALGVADGAAADAVPGAVGAMAAVEACEGGGATMIGLLDGVAAEATLPGWTFDGMIVGLIIVIGADPTPPPTQPDIVTVPVAAVPGACGVVPDVMPCASTVADAIKTSAMNESFMRLSLFASTQRGHA